MDYVDRLRRFNESEKYAIEMEFMFSLMNLKSSDTILDYGCGLGTMVNVLRVRDYTTFGYDVVWYEDSEPPEWWIRNTERVFDHVYFMHSLAHIPDIEKVLKKMRGYAESISIITPNLDWLELKGQYGYDPDPTVVNHFTSETLESLVTTAGFKPLLQGQFGTLLKGQHERLFMKAV